MSKITKLCGVAVAFVLLAGVSGENSSSKERRKQKTVFYGTLVTHTGEEKERNVSNISIANIIEQIEVFEPTGAPAGPLTNDPKKGTLIRLDLSEIAKIEVSEPSKIWTYKRSERSQPTEYVKITVTPRCNGTPKHYLIDLNRRLFCDEKSAGGPIEMDVPFNNIKSLVIVGFHARTEEDSRPSCPVPQPIQE